MKSIRVEVFFLIEPDVPAHLADVSGFALEFEDWSGDEIIACSPYYFASNKVIEAMLSNSITGFTCNPIGS